MKYLRKIKFLTLTDIDMHFNPLKKEVCLNNVSIQDLNSKKTQCVPITKISWLTLFRETITVYSEQRSNT